MRFYDNKTQYRLQNSLKGGKTNEKEVIVCLDGFGTRSIAFVCCLYPNNPNNPAKPTNPSD